MQCYLRMGTVWNNLADLRIGRWDMDVRDCVVRASEISLLSHNLNLERCTCQRTLPSNRDVPDTEASLGVASFWLPLLQHVSKIPIAIL